MPFMALVIGAVIIIAAINNSYPALATELEGDIPGFFKWGIAIAAILGLGYIPGLRTPSRWLLALVAVIIVVTQGQAILDGLKSFTGSAGTASGTPPPTPTAAYSAASAPASQTVTTASGSSITQTASGSSITQATAGSSAGSVANLALGNIGNLASGNIGGAVTNIAGQVAGPLGSTIASDAVTLAANPFDPSAYLGVAEQGFGSLFGGLL